MKCECRDWIPVEVDYKSSGWQGEPVLLKRIPAESCPKCNVIRVDSDEILRAEQKLLAGEIGVAPEELLVLLLLYAPAEKMHPKYPHKIEMRYRMNKMLFYLWKRLEERGFGDSWIHDVFESKERGPVPVHLNEIAKSLEAKGLVRIQWGGKVVKKPFIYDLTQKGSNQMKDMWSKVPEEFRSTANAVKEELLFIDTENLKHKVHREYPDYKATYKQLDVDF